MLNYGFPIFSREEFAMTSVWLRLLRLALAFTVLTALIIGLPGALALSKQDLETGLPDSGTVDKLAKSTVDLPYLSVSSLL